LSLQADRGIAFSAIRSKLYGEKDSLQKNQSIQVPYSEDADNIEKELSPYRIIHIRAFVSVVVRNTRSQVADL